MRHRDHLYSVAGVNKPDVIRRILSHLKLGPTDGEPAKRAGRAPPSLAASPAEVPTEPRYEPLFDDLPWEEPTFDADGPPDDEPMNDSA